jgi:hypothetical protein
MDDMEISSSMDGIAANVGGLGDSIDRVARGLVGRKPGNEDHILMALLEIAKSIDTLAGAFLRIAASIERTEKT